MTFADPDPIFAGLKSGIGIVRMTQSDNNGDAPSVFAISVVFGGILGMVAAAAFGLDGGGGFIVGAALTFMFLSVAILLSREIEHSLHSEEILEVLLATFAQSRLSPADEHLNENSELQRLIKRLLDRRR